MKFLSLDSPLMRFLGRMADLLWLNLLTALCFLPALLSVMYFGDFNIVVGLCLIPILFAGAGFTALHFVCLKMVRNEEGYLTRDFFKSFKENFVQGTVIWVIFLVMAALMLADFRIVFNSPDITGLFRTLMIGGLLLVCMLLLFTVIFIFPVLSHFKNTIRGTIKNSFLMSLLVLPKTVLMVIIIAIPPVACLVYQLIPIAGLFFFSGPAYVCALLYNKTFKRFEPETEAPSGDYEWTVAESDEAEQTAESAIESVPSDDSGENGDGTGNGSNE